ncbi:uncharacterized protein LOC131009747 [Salvia miltiorrhiza]|uniref:uncharacterized protein LOC131009747 n=1 Tax=Salvia miltiorrhiza TaxID=226208 RepID=UPI0025AC549E|nr:uncharacterized protein LOC131009747 [Salvia miltiorrhiza]
MGNRSGGRGMSGVRDGEGGTGTGRTGGRSGGADVWCERRGGGTGTCRTGGRSGGANLRPECSESQRREGMSGVRGRAVPEEGASMPMSGVRDGEGEREQVVLEEGAAVQT